MISPKFLNLCVIQNLVKHVDNQRTFPGILMFSLAYFAAFQLPHVRLRILISTNGFTSSVLNAVLTRISREVSLLILVVTGWVHTSWSTPSVSLTRRPLLHRTMPGLWDPSFQTSLTHPACSEALSHFQEEDPRPLVFLALSLGCCSQTFSPFRCCLHTSRRLVHTANTGLLRCCLHNSRRLQ